MRVVGAAILILAIILGGCVSDASPRADISFAGTSAPAEVSVQVSEDHGAVDGIVTDASLLPLADAVVTLGSGDGSEPVAILVTSDSGRFAFSRLDPGAYRLSASHANFTNAVQLVQVIVGHTTTSNLLLQDVATTEPYLLVVSRVGALNCATAFVLSTTGSACSQGVSNRWAPEIPSGHGYIVTETTWASPNEQLYQLGNFWHIDGEKQAGRLNDTKGPAVLRMDFFAGMKVAKTFGGGTPYSAVPDSAFGLDVLTYYSGVYANEIDQAANSACRASTIAEQCHGVGITADLRFTVFLSVFVHAVPTHPAQYSALPDE